MSLKNYILRILTLLIFIGIYSHQSFAQTKSQNVFRNAVNEEYLGFKLNYGFRSLSRQACLIDVGIDSANNEFGTYIFDQYRLKEISNMKGISLGVEYGTRNIFIEGQFDYMARNKTESTGLNAFFGYNFTFMEGRAIAFRPALGVSYNWVTTALGSYPSADKYHNSIDLKQSNALAGITPRMQLELPIIKIKEDAVIFIRGEVGYQFFTYTSRFIKLKAQRNYANSKGNYKYDSDRFYLDGEHSGYQINGQHLNKPPTSIGGLYYSIELAIKIINF